MEHIITSNVMGYAARNNILYPLQHGFRDKRSCETQLLEFIAEVNNHTQHGGQTDVLIMDFSKAFDKVGHKRLALKLDHYGIRGKTNAWISSFLNNRKQTVVLDGERSEEVDVLSGVPQGSVLGPCLFLFYINDLPLGLKSKVRLFADDTILYLCIVDEADSNALQQDLAKLEEWEVNWQMEFHPGKCQVLTISRRKQPLIFHCTLHGHWLERVNAATYLGITISGDLRWNTHITNISAKANKALVFLRRNLKINSPPLKAVAYKTLVRLLVEYVSSSMEPLHAT